MKLTELAKLSKGHIINAGAQFTYQKIGLDFTKPTVFYGIITDRCNLQCRYCHHWRLDTRNQEMNIEEWKKALLSVQEFVGNYFINFSGGEPFLKENIFDLFELLKNNNIKFGITSNGLMLASANLAEKFVLSRPFNLNISCESATPAVHDYIRNKSGLHEKISQAMKLVLEMQKKHKINFPIILKTTVNALNFKQLPELIDWATKTGFSAITFQPIGPWTKEAQEELMIKKDNLPALKELINKLINLKQKGTPIMNSEEALKMIVDFVEEKEKTKKNQPCKVGMENFFIYPNGDIFFCSSMPAIGNIKNNSAKNIWQSDEAKKIRKATLSCNKLCLSTCHSDKTIINKIKKGLKLIVKKTPN